MPFSASLDCQILSLITFQILTPLVYIHLSQENSSAVFEKLNCCLDDAKEWMSASKHQFNPDKTKFIVFGSKRQREKLKGYFPSTILSRHVQKVCKSCFVQPCEFRYVRRFLTHDASVLVTNAVVSSRLDYCNSLFRSLSKFNLHKLQCIQNSAASIVSNTNRYTSITPILKKLHLLPVEHRSVFKTATRVYKFFHTGFPKSFAPYISSYSSSYSTRCNKSGENFLVIPKFQPSVHKSVKQFGHSFAFDAPTVWNVLPEEIPVPPLLLPSENASKPTFTPKHTLLSLTYPWRSPWCWNSFLSVVIEIVDCFCFVAP